MLPENINLFMRQPIICLLVHKAKAVVLLVLTLISLVSCESCSKPQGKETKHPIVPSSDPATKSPGSPGAGSRIAITKEMLNAVAKSNSSSPFKDTLQQVLNDISKSEEPGNCSVKIESWKYERALLGALELGVDANIIQALLQRKDHVEGTIKWHAHLLQAIQKDEKVLQAFLQEVNTEIASSMEKLLLESVLYFGSPNMLKALLLDPKIQVKARSLIDKDLLGQAIKLNKKDIVIILLDTNLNPTASNLVDSEVLIDAICYGGEDAAAVFLDPKVNPNLSTPTDEQIISMIQTSIYLHKKGIIRQFLTWLIKNKYDIKKIMGRKYRAISINSILLDNEFSDSKQVFVDLGFFR